MRTTLFFACLLFGFSFGFTESLEEQPLGLEQLAKGISEAIPLKQLAQTDQFADIHLTSDPSAICALDEEVNQSVMDLSSHEEVMPPTCLMKIKIAEEQGAVSVTVSKPSLENLFIAEASPNRIAVENAILGENEQVPKNVDIYDELPITEEEKELISTLLTTMAQNSVFKLLFEKKRLEKIGRRIHHVHPLRFLGTVFSNTKLVQCLREIRKSGFKWDGFVEGFSGRMVEESGRNNLVRYVNGFAKEVGVDPHELLPYLEESDFEGLIKKLMKLVI